MGGAQQAVTGQEWYVLRGEMKYGPYEYKSLITMIQTGELYDYNFVWAPHLENWTLVGELQEFSKDRLCRLIETKDHLAGAFTERKHPRVDLVVPVYAHNDHSFFDGETQSVSENGALVLLNDPLLLPEQKVLIHFRESEKNPVSFNVLAEIVRKNFSKQRLNVKSGLHYAVRFLQVQDHGKNQLTKWSRGGVAKGETL
ncbi:PilZ domain-containing protein [Bdellovibrio sp. HCB2-146]|uniref:PilZ domain-containing protein n=1 Tax=Bdellovibrio sp. HCB2-146 TaxID=3394362 RepID=UPI0039BC4724